MILAISISHGSDPGWAALLDLDKLHEIAPIVEAEIRAGFTSYDQTVELTGCEEGLNRIHEAYVKPPQMVDKVVTIFVR